MSVSGMTYTWIVHVSECMTYTWIVHVSEWYDVYLDSSCQ